MRVSERRDRILALVRREQRVAVDLLAEKLDASHETIRRDLADLAIRGLVRKFHGGAALPENSVADEITEGSFQARLTEHVGEKRLVAQAAAALFAPGDTLFVDTGTTTFVFAEELARVSGLTVITNSVLIAQAITRGAGGSRVFLLGGEFNEEAAETLGPLVIEQIHQFHAVHAVLTVGAITTQGLLDFSMEETEVARAMIEQANQVTVLADGSKLHKAGLFQVCPLASINRLVIDRPPSGAIDGALREAEVEMVVASTLGDSGSTGVSHGRRRRRSNNGT
jgi:DeoR family transcriptional regulator, glycerol-3-phosphate regulon repressor